MRLAKRAFDLAAAAAGVLALAPVLGLAAVLIRLEDGGPVFFRQERIGRGGRPFRIWKLRTMSVDAPSRGPSLTVGGDHRITRIGAVLRRYKLDEFPQLLNVLAGEMSLVGPRPEVARYVSRYTSEQRRVLEHLPGITDPASLRYRDENEVLRHYPDAEAAYLGVVMPDKLRINLAYAGRASFWSDLLVVAATVAPPLARYVSEAAPSPSGAPPAGPVPRVGPRTDR